MDGLMPPSPSDRWPSIDAREISPSTSAPPPSSDSPSPSRPPNSNSNVPSAPTSNAACVEPPGKSSAALSAVRLRDDVEGSGGTIGFSGLSPGLRTLEGSDGWCCRFDWAGGGDGGRVAGPRPPPLLPMKASTSKPASAPAPGLGCERMAARGLTPTAGVRAALMGSVRGVDTSQSLAEKLARSCWLWRPFCDAWPSDGEKPAIESECANVLGDELPRASSSQGDIGATGEGASVDWPGGAAGWVVLEDDGGPGASLAAWFEGRLWPSKGRKAECGRCGVVVAGGYMAARRNASVPASAVALPCPGARSPADSLEPCAAWTLRWYWGSRKLSRSSVSCATDRGAWSPFKGESAAGGGWTTRPSWPSDSAQSSIRMPAIGLPAASAAGAVDVEGCFWAAGGEVDRAGHWPRPVWLPLAWLPALCSLTASRPPPRSSAGAAWVPSAWLSLIRLGGRLTTTRRPLSSRPMTGHWQARPSRSLRADAERRVRCQRPGALRQSQRRVQGAHQDAQVGRTKSHFFLRERHWGRERRPTVSTVLAGRPGRGGGGATQRTLKQPSFDRLSFSLRRRDDCSPCCGDGGLPS